MHVQAVDLRNGSKIEYNNDVWVVVERVHRTPGNWRALIQTRLRSLTNGRSTEVRFSSNEKVKLADLEHRRMQYLYRDSAGFMFMDTDTYEQISIPPDELGENALYLLQDMEIDVQFLKGKAIGVELPNFVEMAIEETEPGSKGDTVTNVLKAAKMPTGLVVQVPLFINEGDLIKIDTRTGEYVTRVSKK